MEEPMRNNTLIPRNLVMTLNECFYCGIKDPDFIQIQRLFGLKACNDHKACAIRDCNAYMHNMKMVKFEDAIDNSKIAPFINYLQNKSGGFSILRSNGNLEKGWILKPHVWYNPCLIGCVEDEWHILCHNPTKELEKSVKISSFASQVPIELINDAITTLNEGIYKNDYMLFNLYSNKDLSQEVPECEGVYTIPGTNVRIFI